jgi:hypothetical protein
MSAGSRPRRRRSCWLPRTASSSRPSSRSRASGSRRSPVSKRAGQVRVLVALQACRREPRRLPRGLSARDHDVEHRARHRREVGVRGALRAALRASSGTGRTCSPSRSPSAASRCCTWSSASSRRRAWRSRGTPGTALSGRAAHVALLRDDEAPGRLLQLAREPGPQAVRRASRPARSGTRRTPRPS